MIYQLIGIRGPQSGRVFAIGQSQVMWLGRTPEATVPIASVLASRRHAELRIEPAGVVLRDLGSANGTRVNGQRIAARPLGPGDVIEIGDEAFRFAWGSAEAGVGPSRGQIAVVKGPLTGRAFGLGTASISFGRAPDCTIVVQSQRASRRHAEIRFEVAGVVVHDLGSGNGTTVNGRKITAHPLVHGDLIEIGDEAFRYDATPSSTRMRASPLAASAPVLEPARATMATIDPDHGAWGQSTARHDGPGRLGPQPRSGQAVQLAVPSAPVPTPLASPVAPSVAHGQPAVPSGPTSADATFKLGIRCPRCGRVVDARLADCPWDGAALVNGKSVL